MMRATFGVVLLLGLALAGYAVYAAQKEFTKYQVALQRQQEAIVPVQEVYVARRALRYGDRLRPSDVKAIAWPASSLPSGIFTSREQIFPPESTELRTVLRDMEADEPLLIVKLTAPGEDAICLVEVDGIVPDEVMARLEAVSHVKQVKSLTF